LIERLAELECASTSCNALAVKGRVIVHVSSVSSITSFARLHFSIGLSKVLLGLGPVLTDVAPNFARSFVTSGEDGKGSCGHIDSWHVRQK
jgi:hypothetical protein